MYILHTLSLIIADHHNKFDSTKLDRLFIIIFLTCICIGYFVNKLIKEDYND